MCEWGDNISLKVPIMPEVSHTGQFRWDIKSIDRCLAPYVQALNDAGLFTGGCCCGHGQPGQDKYIGLHDGTVLTFTSIRIEDAVDGYVRLNQDSE